MDWVESQATQIINTNLRRWVRATTPADHELIGLTAATAGFSISLGMTIQANGATVAMAAVQAKVTAQLRRCVRMLEATGPYGPALLQQVLQQADNLGQALLVLAEPEGEA